MANSSTVNLAIVSSSPLLRLGIAQFVEGLQLGYRCVLTAASVLQLQQQMTKTAVEVLVVDLGGSNEDRASLAQQLLILSAGNALLNIVVYTACHNTAILAPLYARKSVSLIDQQGSAEQIGQEMAEVLAGGKLCSASLKGYFNQVRVAGQAGSDALTDAERNVMTHLFAGLSLTAIAELSHRSIKTISAHKCNGMRKLGVHTDAELFQLPPHEVVLAGKRPGLR